MRSLLEYHPDIKIDGELSQFELVAGTERKSTGSYYTPPELVRELIKSALEPVIVDRLAKAKTREEKERALLALKVCDPSSGSGHFMLAASRRLGRELARVRSGEAEPNPADYRHAVRDVIRCCIYAVDKNPSAVDLCKVALWIEGHEPGLPLSFLDHHVKCGDALIGVLDLGVLREGVPNDAYKPVTGDDKEIAAEIKRRNRADAKTLFRANVQQRIDHIANSFAALADLPETNPDEVSAKQAAYAALRRSDDWQGAKWACDLWTAAFFTPLVKDGAEAVPTTRHVWEAAAGREPQERMAALTAKLALAQPFFQWPLEFPEVFAAGGFDVMLGNPPWGIMKSSETDLSSREVTETDLVDAEGMLSDDLTCGQGLIGGGKLRADSVKKFVRASARFGRAAHGKLNTYGLFSELFTSLISSSGHSGFIVPTGIATDATSKSLFTSWVETGQLRSLYSFENEDLVFEGIHHSIRFCLVTIVKNPTAPTTPEFAFFLRRADHLTDSRRRYTLTADEIAAINPTTRTAPIFRTRSDAELTARVYSHTPVLFAAEGPKPFDVEIVQNFFSSSNKSDKALFAAASLASSENVLPVLRGTMIDQYHHRASTYDPATERFREPTIDQLMDTRFHVRADKQVESRQVHLRLRGINWIRDWLIGWRDITSAHVLRTVIASAFPVCGTDDTLSLILPRAESIEGALLLSSLNSIVLDYIARQKVGGIHIRKYVIAQFPIIAARQFDNAAKAFITSRVVELTYTAEDMRPFAQDLGYEGPPFIWDSERRALLRAELDAYYAYLYNLTRRELQYILDPKAVMGEDYPSETFRVLKQSEVKEFGEYRTQRLVLQAWDRFVSDGTFDLTRLNEPQYIDRVAQELSATRARLEETERNYLALIERASDAPKPTLFVEGITDVAILEAAWSVFFPDEPIPVKVLAAGGTTQMGSLAGKGRALRELLGSRMVLALADNNSEGRRLMSEDAKIRRGGHWGQLLNGIYWCLLRPTADFLAAMKAQRIPEDLWPFSIEAAFSPSLRRAALAAGGYEFSGSLQAEIFNNPDVARRLAPLIPSLGRNDDAYWYLMAPHRDYKEAFAAWVTAPNRRTEQNYVAFDEIMRGLRAVIAAPRNNSDATGGLRGAA